MGTLAIIKSNIDKYLHKDQFIRAFLEIGYHVVLQCDHRHAFNGLYACLNYDPDNTAEHWSSRSCTDDELKEDTCTAESVFISAFPIQQECRR